jgi:hypothetical protein
MTNLKQPPISAIFPTAKHTADSIHLAQDDFKRQTRSQKQQQTLGKRPAPTKAEDS